MYSVLDADSHSVNQTSDHPLLLAMKSELNIEESSRCLLESAPQESSKNRRMRYTFFTSNSLLLGRSALFLLSVLFFLSALLQRERITRQDHLRKIIPSGKLQCSGKI